MFSGSCQWAGNAPSGLADVQYLLYGGVQFEVTSAPENTPAMPDLVSRISQPFHATICPNCHMIQVLRDHEDSLLRGYWEELDARLRHNAAVSLSEATASGCYPAQEQLQPVTASTEGLYSW